MPEVWELKEDQIHILVLAGVDDEGIKRLNKSRHETYLELNKEVYGENPHDLDNNHFYLKYGFVHDCHCVDDTFVGNIIEVPRCRIKMGDEALDALQELLPERDMLVEANDLLRDQIINLGETPVI